MSILINILKKFAGAQPYHSSDWLNSENGYPEYYALSDQLKPRTVLEIGTFLGFSAASIILGSERVTKMVCIDNQSYISNSNALAAQNIGQFIDSDWLQIHSTYPVLTETFDLAHIDGEHTHAQKLFDLNYVKNHTDTIWVDDYTYMSALMVPVVQQFISENPAWQLTTVHPTYRGLAILNKKNLNIEP